MTALVLRIAILAGLSLPLVAEQSTGTTCNGTNVVLDGTAMETTCTADMRDGTSCSLRCAAGKRAIGIFHCADGRLHGSPQCLPEGTVTRRVTRIVGALRLTSQRQRTLGLGKSFGASVGRALQGLLMDPSRVDVARLSVQLLAESEQPGADAQVDASGSGPVMGVDYELLLEKTWWDDAIAEDLGNLERTDSAAHEKFVAAMDKGGHPVSGIVAPWAPVHFEDVVGGAAADSSDADSSDAGVAMWLLIGGGAAFLLACCSAACFMGLGLYLLSRRNAQRGLLSPSGSPTGSPTAKAMAPAAMPSMRSVATQPATVEALGGSGTTSTSTAV